METRVPFAGFYESRYSQMLDNASEQEAEELVKRQSSAEFYPKSFVPEPLERLDEREVSDILCDVADYSAAYRQIAKDYVEAFDEKASGALGIELGLDYSLMTSPAYYNFETDRVFATIKPEAVQAMFERSEAEEHKALAAVIKRRCTSRSGFISWYSNDLDEWLAKPVAEWDHNEVEILLIAMLIMAMGEDAVEGIDDAIFEDIAEKDYEYFSDAVDWDELDLLMAAKRAEKREEAIDDGLIDPDSPPPTVRCPYTTDMFAGR